MGKAKTTDYFVGRTIKRPAGVLVKRMHRASRCGYRINDLQTCRSKSRTLIWIVGISAWQHRCFHHRSGRFLTNV